MNDDDIFTGTDQLIEDLLIGIDDWDEVPDNKQLADMFNQAVEAMGEMAQQLIALKSLFSSLDKVVGKLASGITGVKSLTEIEKDMKPDNETKSDVSDGYI